MERFRYESLPDDLDRALEPDEIMAFADDVVWPAIDHIYGTDFRARAQVKRKTRMPRKTREIEGPNSTERITLDAFSDPNHTIKYYDDEIFRACAANLTMEEMRPELAEGMVRVLEADTGDDDEADRWWLDEDLLWEPWEARTFHFSNDPTMPLTVFHTIEAHDAEERSPTERMLWDFNDEANFERVVEGEPAATRQGRRSQRRKDKRVNKKIELREEEFMAMLSLRDCLEIRAALIRFGVPAEVLRMAA